MRPTSPIRAACRLALTAGTLAVVAVPVPAVVPVTSTSAVAARRCPVVHVVGSASAPGGAARTPARRAGSAAMSIQVTVPRLVVVRLAADGTPAAAMTNTGEPPQPADELAVVSPTGRVAVTGEDDLRGWLDELTAVDWSRSGRWHPITC